jgi:archaellum component FlaC
MWLVLVAEKAGEHSSVWSGDAFVGGVITLVGVIVTTFGAVFVKKLDKQEKRQAELERGQATIHESIRFNGGDTDSLSDRLDRFGARMDTRLDQIEGRMDSRLDGVARRINDVAKRVDDVADGQAVLSAKMKAHMEHPPGSSSVA